MTNLRLLCEKYIEIDNKVNQLSKQFDKETNLTKKQKLTADYLQAYMEREDFKSGIRRHLIIELVHGIKTKPEKQKEHENYARILTTCKKYNIKPEDLPQVLEEYIAYDNDDQW